MELAAGEVRLAKEASPNTIVPAEFAVHDLDGGAFSALSCGGVYAGRAASPEQSVEPPAGEHGSETLVLLDDRLGASTGVERRCGVRLGAEGHARRVFGWA